MARCSVTQVGTRAHYTCGYHRCETWAWHSWGRWGGWWRPGWNPSSHPPAARHLARYQHATWEAGQGQCSVQSTQKRSLLRLIALRVIMAIPWIPWIHSRTGQSGLRKEFCTFILWECKNPVLRVYVLWANWKKLWWIILFAEDFSIVAATVSPRCDLTSIAHNPTVTIKNNEGLLWQMTTTTKTKTRK